MQDIRKSINKEYLGHIQMILTGLNGGSRLLYQMIRINNDLSFKYGEKQNDNGGVIVLPNIVKLDDNNIKKIGDWIASVNSKVCLKIGNFLEYKSQKDGFIFDTSSRCIELLNLDLNKLLEITIKLCGNLNLELVLLKEYTSTSIIYLTNKTMY